MNIFTSQKELKKWAISMANACGGMEVVQNNIIKKQSPKKIENLTIKFVSDYNAMVKIAMEKIAKDTIIENGLEPISDKLKEELKTKGKEGDI